MLDTLKDIWEELKTAERVIMVLTVPLWAPVLFILWWADSATGDTQD